MNKERIIKTVDRFSKRSVLVPIIFILIMIGGIICIFSFSTGINSYDIFDYVEGISWAEATLRSGSAINPQYIYYYIVPFGSNLIMAPFVFLLGPCLLANQLGMLVYFLIYLAVLYRLSGSFYQQKTKRLLFCSIVSLFFFTYVGDNLLHHLLCYGIGFVCFLGELSCILQIWHGQKPKWNLILLVFFCLWSSANGLAASALATLPILAGLLLSMFRQTDKRKGKLLLVITVSMFAGLLLYRYCDMKATTLDQYDKRFILTSADAIATNLIHDLFRDYLRVFYFDPDGVSALSAKGVFFFIKLLFGLLIPALPFLLHRYDRKEDHPIDEDRFLLLSSAILVLLLCLGQYVFFKASAERYLFNGILSLFLICALSVTDHAEGLSRYLLLPLCVFVLLMSGKMLFHTLPSGKEKLAVYEKISDFLVENDLFFGYSIYRKYTVLDVLSDGRIHDLKIYYDKDTGHFRIDRDRIYLDEEKKPQDLNRFYILKNTVSNSENADEILLENTCRNKFVIDELTVYVFDITDWDSVFKGE